MPIVVLRIMLLGGRAHGGETGQQGAHAYPKITCFSFGSPFKYPERGQDLACWDLESRAKQFLGDGGWDGCQGLGATLPT